MYIIHTYIYIYIYVCVCLLVELSILYLGTHVRCMCAQVLLIYLEASELRSGGRCQKT